MILIGDQLSGGAIVGILIAVIVVVVVPVTIAGIILVICFWNLSHKSKKKKV